MFVKHVGWNNKLSFKSFFFSIEKIFYLDNALGEKNHSVFLFHMRRIKVKKEKWKEMEDIGSSDGD